MVAPTLFTLFANDFAEEVFNITVNGNINTASTSQASANPSQSHPITFSNGGANNNGNVSAGLASYSFNFGSFSSENN